MPLNCQGSKKSAAQRVFGRNQQTTAGGTGTPQTCFNQVSKSLSSQCVPERKRPRLLDLPTGARLLGAVTAKGSKGRCCAGSRCVFACSVARAEDYTLGTLSSNLECRSFISSASFVDCIMTMQSPRESTWRPHSVDLASSCGRLSLKLHTIMYTSTEGAPAQELYTL